MVSHALRASEIIEEKGFSAAVIDMHTIKPLDTKVIKKHFYSRLFVSIEEHNIIGGLGTAISEYLSSEKHSPNLFRIGISDRFSNPGDYNHLLSENRLMPQEIAEDILTKFLATIFALVLLI